jgi:hypothetical protein
VDPIGRAVYKWGQSAYHSEGGPHTVVVGP